MADSPSVKGFFQALVTEQLVTRVVDATVGVVVATVASSAGPALAGPLGAVAVPLLNKAVEYFGPAVATRIWRWITDQPSVEACVTLEAVANLDARTTRLIIDAVVEETAPDAPQEAKSIAKSYLASIPAMLRQSMPRTPSGKSTCPAALLPRSEQDVFRLLPTFLPPYNAPCPLPGTQYQLHELLGTGGFGAVYKATATSERDPRAIKFCLDPEWTITLRQDKDRLDRLVSDEGGRDWPENVVRLIGHNFDHETPFLIFEYVPDGDLGIYVNGFRGKHGRGMNPADVLCLMRKLAFAVQQVHARGLIHRDLKPNNILFSGQVVKIADFGMGAVVPHQDRDISRRRTSVETTGEMRGGTWQYMSPEQKKNWKVTPHPAQDVYSLGVIWYQLLVADFRDEPGVSLEDRLVEQAVPSEQTELLKKCLDDRPTKRPGNAADLVVSIDRVIRNVEERDRHEREVERQRQVVEANSKQRVRQAAAPPGPIRRAVAWALRAVKNMLACSLVGAFAFATVGAIIYARGWVPWLRVIGIIAVLCSPLLYLVHAAYTRKKTLPYGCASVFLTIFNLGVTLIVFNITSARGGSPLERLLREPPKSGEYPLEFACYSGAVGLVVGLMVGIARVAKSK